MIGCKLIVFWADINKPCKSDTSIAVTSKNIAANSATISPHHYIGTSSHHHIAASLYHYIATSPHRYMVVDTCVAVVICCDAMSALTDAMSALCRADVDTCVAVVICSQEMIALCRADVNTCVASIVCCDAMAYKYCLGNTSIAANSANLAVKMAIIAPNLYQA